MRNNLRNIKNLSVFFIKDNISNFDLIKDKKINKKSSWFWLIIIWIFSYSFITCEVMETFGNNIKILIYAYFFLLNILLVIQTVMITTNIFYFAKDLEVILPKPFKPLEIALSKFNVLLYFLYSTLILLGIIPLLIYGINMSENFLYFIKVIVVLIIFPIFPALVISVATMILVRIFSFVKNKNILQILITALLFFAVFIGLSNLFDIKNIVNNSDNFEQVSSFIDNYNKYFFNVRLSINFLDNDKFLQSFGSLVKLIGIDLVAFCIYFFISKNLYINQLLKINSFFKKKKLKNINLNKKCKKHKIYLSYIKKEIEDILKNPLYFIQCIYPVMIMTLVVVIFMLTIIPTMKKLNIEYHLFDGITFNLEILMLIVGIIQFIGLGNKISVTAISREGKNAYIMKYIPIDLYKQFVYKNIPQIGINSICSLIILFILFFLIQELEKKYMLFIFIISFIMFCINSYILLILNLLVPKNKWDIEYEIFKNNKNILLQYILIAINIFVVYYNYKVFMDFDLSKAILCIIMILIIIFVILNIFINKSKNKLFKTIK